jgi:hypothetical protein
MEKFFLIGRSNTGTGSIDKAFNLTGFKTLRDRSELNHKGLAKSIISKMKQYDAFTAHCDLTIEDIKKIEKEYPSAKFILTTRETDAWYVSWLKRHGKEATEEDPREEERNFKLKVKWANFYYENFNKDVLTHFKGREWKLLHIKLGENNNWGAFCSFVKASLPQGSFPHENKS